MKCVLPYHVQRTTVSYIAEKDINFSSKIASGIFKKKKEEEKSLNMDKHPYKLNCISTCIYYCGNLMLWKSNIIQATCIYVFVLMFAFIALVSELPQL